MTVMDLDTGETVDELVARVARLTVELERLQDDEAWLAWRCAAMEGVIQKQNHELDALRNGQPAPVVVTLIDRGVGDGYTVEQ